MSAIKQVTESGVSYATGAVRSSDAEGVRYDLISPIGLRRVAETCREGADKYSDYNWEKGMPIADLLNHATAHIYKYLSGDRSEDHLGHAAWNLMGAAHSEELWPHLNENLRGAGCKPPEASPGPPAPESIACSSGYDPCRDGLVHCGKLGCRFCDFSTAR